MASGDGESRAAEERNEEGRHVAAERQHSSGLGWPDPAEQTASGLGWPDRDSDASSEAPASAAAPDAPEASAPGAPDPGDSAGGAGGEVAVAADPAPAAEPAPPERVSRETSSDDAATVEPTPRSGHQQVSRETAAPADAADDTPPANPGPAPSAGETGVVSNAAVAYRFGPARAPGSRPRTAAEIAAAGSDPVASPATAPASSAPTAGATGVSSPGTGFGAAGAALDPSTPLAAEVAAQLSRVLPSRAPVPRPPETRVLVVANQKGGVGKTTTAVNLAAALAQRGQRVLVVDLDPQGNASTALNVEHPPGTPSSYDVIADGKAIAEVVQETPETPDLHLVPATIDLAGAEIELVSMVARESRLRRALDAFLAETEAAGRRYDYVLIDCPPSLGLLTVNALVAGREMLIPIQCEYYALEGVSQLLKNIELIREHLNPELRISTVLLTMFDARTRLAAQVAQEVRGHFGAAVLRTAIPRSVRISEAPSYGQTVITYDPASPGALSYLEAARELAAAGGGPEEPATA